VTLLRPGGRLPTRQLRIGDDKAVNASNARLNPGFFEQSPLVNQPHSTMVFEEAAMSRSLAIEPTSQTKQQRSMNENVEDQIRMRAYELYEARGYVDGHDVEDWYQAEEELSGQGKTSRAA
jgi:hypothetical protein